MAYGTINVNVLGTQYVVYFTQSDVSKRGEGV